MDDFFNPDFSFDADQMLTPDIGVPSDGCLGGDIMKANLPDNDLLRQSEMALPTSPIIFSQTDAILNQMFMPTNTPPVFPLTGKPLDADSTQESIQRLVDDYVVEHRGPQAVDGEVLEPKYVELGHTTLRPIGTDSVVPEYVTMRIDVSGLSEDEVARVLQFKSDYSRWDSIANYHLSGAARDARIEAEKGIAEIESKSREVIEAQHERDCAHASGMTIDQYRAEQKPGMEQVFPRGAWGEYQGDPDLFVEKDTGKIYKIGPDHELHLV